MIFVLNSGESVLAGDLVHAALCRSVPANMIERVCASRLHAAAEQELADNIWVLIDPIECWSVSIERLLTASHSKILLLGRVPVGMWSLLGLSASGKPSDLGESAKAPAAPPNGVGCSLAKVEYRCDIDGHASPLQSRYFSRYDFMEEWNNIGYGAITTDDSPWSLAASLKAPDSAVIAQVVNEDADVSTYAGLWNQSGSLLWFARSVGPLDSQEWRLVEVYLAHFRYESLPCVPVLSEIPAGYDSAVTMRLDCDEDVESARALWNSYLEQGVPLSLALHATVMSDDRHHLLPVDVLNSGGSLLSHTLTHAPNWGGSYEAAHNEGVESKAVIEAAIGHSVRYAVSPFHHTPVYARRALSDAGYEGCVGGIICNDPDFMTARAGVDVGLASGFIGFSQQCMLHGDCMREGAEPLASFKQSFKAALAGRQFFGYLDHPFSERYAYGWHSEEQRISAHKQFLAYIRETGGKVLFANMEDAFDFLKAKNMVRAESLNGEDFKLICKVATPNGWQLTYEYCGAKGVVEAA